MESNCISLNLLLFETQIRFPFLKHTVEIKFRNEKYYKLNNIYAVKFMLIKFYDEMYRFFF